MRVLELFAGAGGMALGFHRAGFDPVALVEWDAHAQCVLRTRFPGVPLYGDVQEVDGREIVRQHGPVDLVSGGSPCQDLSVAGKRAGLGGSRSGLFHEQMRIWEETGAVYCLWENVLGALSSNKGADFAAVLSAFVGRAVAVPVRGWKGGGGVVAGPTGVAAWRVLDAQYFGVPQRRRRVFVLGARPGGVDPAHVLLECDGLCGDSAAGSEAWEAAPAVAGGESAGGELVGSLDTECGYTKATFQSVLMGHIIPTVDKQSGAVSVGVTATLKTDLAHQMGPVVVAPTLSASNNPSRSPQSSEVTAQVAAVFAAEVAPTLPSSGAGVARTGNERTEAEFVVVQPVISFDWQKGNDDKNPRPSTMNVSEEQTGTLGATRVPAVVQPVYPIQTPDRLEKGQNGLGIAAPDAPMYSLEAASVHGVVQPVAWDHECNSAPRGLGPTLGHGPEGSPRTGVVQPVAWDEEVNAAPPGLGPTLGRGGAGGRRDGVVAFKPGQSEAAGGTFVTEEIAPTLQGSPNGSTMVPAIHHPLGRPRRLLPVETERLMGWPDNHTLVPDPRGKPMADSHRYKMCGNGVVANVAEWIGRRLLEAEQLADAPM